MTQEEKVRAYDEALSVALETYKTQPTYRDWLEKMFPELKESDDEKIRKALIEMVHDTTGDSLWVDYNVHKEDAIAWLEKQANHANFRNKIEVGDKVTRNRDGVLVNLSQLNRVAKKEEKQGELKPTDEEMKTLLQTEYEKGRADVIAKQKPSWSEEDENRINRLIAYFEDKQSFTAEDDVEYANWLKSIRPQSQWKPSEEQMIAISTAINVLGKGTLNGKYLIELHEQLKKLKE